MISFVEVEIDTADHINPPSSLVEHMAGGVLSQSLEITKTQADEAQALSSPTYSSEDLIYLDSAAQVLSCLSMGFNPVSGEKLREGPWSEIPVAQKILDLMCQLLSEKGVDIELANQSAKNTIQENVVEVQAAPKAKRWNRVEDELLSEEVLGGISCAEIAKVHGRDIKSIEDRVKKLGLAWPVLLSQTTKTLTVELPVVPSAKNLDLFDTLISPSVARSETISPMKTDFLEKIPEDFIDDLAIQNQQVLDELEAQWKSN